MYPPKQEPSHEQTLHWLRWLSQKLTAESKPEFAIEEMQPSWLETSRQKLLYRIGVGLTYGLMFLLFVGLLVGLSFGLLVALFFALIGGLNFQEIGLFFGFTWGVNFWLIGLSFWLIGRLDLGLIDEIKPIKSFNLSKQKLKDRLNYGLIAGVACSAVTSPSYGPPGLMLGLNIVLISLLTAALFSSLKDTETKTRTIPNQPISESTRNATMLGLLSLAVCMLAGILPQLALETKGAAVEIRWVLMIGLGGGLFFSLAAGGLPSIQHLILRFLLWRSGDIPWNYARFLNYSAERGFLERVDGNYKFIRDVVQEPVPEMQLCHSEQIEESPSSDFSC